MGTTRKSHIRPPASRLERELQVRVTWDGCANDVHRSCTVTLPDGKFLCSVSVMSVSSCVPVKNGPLFTGHTRYKNNETGKEFSTNDSNGIWDLIREALYTEKQCENT